EAPATSREGWEIGKSNVVVGMLGFALGVAYAAAGHVITCGIVLVISMVAFAVLSPLKMLFWSGYSRWLGGCTVVGILLGTFLVLFFGCWGSISGIYLPRAADGTIRKSPTAGILVRLAALVRASEVWHTPITFMLMFLGPWLLLPVVTAIQQSVEPQEL